MGKEIGMTTSNTFGSLVQIESYLKGPLIECLPNAYIRRVLEVGTMFDFYKLRQLVWLRKDNLPIFSPNNVLAIDPNLPSDDILKVVLGTDEDKFRRERIAVEELRDRIKAGTMPPFDLVLSKGVVSIGWNLPKDKDENRQQIDKILIIVDAMRGCMNLDNPNALLLIETQLSNGMLLLSRQHLASIGLSIVFSRSTNNPWAQIIREWGNFPDNPSDSGYQLVLCKPL